jgi:hypothetical protein
LVVSPQGTTYRQKYSPHHGSSTGKVAGKIGSTVDNLKDAAISLSLGKHISYDLV